MTSCDFGQLCQDCGLPKLKHLPTDIKFTTAYPPNDGITNDAVLPLGAEKDRETQDKTLLNRNQHATR